MDRDTFATTKQAKVDDRRVDVLRSPPNGAPHAHVAAPIDALTDDTLYHLLNGADVDGASIFPPQCRWAPALVCRRWRDVIKSITCADAQRARAQLDSRVHPNVSFKGLHVIVSASGMALMARHGLGAVSFGMWTLVQPTVAETAAILVASGRSDHLGEALGLASWASVDGGWSKLGDALKAALVDKIGRKSKPCGAASPKRARRMLLWVAARHCNGEIIHRISVQCERKCAITAVEHAIRFDRVAACGVLLEIYDIAPKRGCQIFYSKSRSGRSYDPDANKVWLAVGRWGALSVAEMLLEVERSGRLTIDDHLRYTLSRKAQYDGMWTGDWLDWGAAVGDQPQCLDFCHRHGLKYKRRIALSRALCCGSVAFCQRFIELYPPSVYPHILSRAVEFTRCMNDKQPLHPRAAAWLIGIPELERSDKEHFERLWCRALSSKDTDIGTSLKTALSIIRRWPDTFHDVISSLPFPQVERMYRDDDPLVIKFLMALPADRAEEAKQKWKSCNPRIWSIWPFSP